MPYICQVAVGRRAYPRVFGGDYPTPDGTGVRDYIHVMDLAAGHIAALHYLKDHAGLVTLNLGTGRGVSVLEMVQAFARATGQVIPYRIEGRRPGDVAACWADPAAASALLRGARYDLERMCRDAWRWQSAHPEGHGRRPMTA